MPPELKPAGCAVRSLHSPGGESSLALFKGGKKEEGERMESERKAPVPTGSGSRREELV